jgi:hypothetical protein
MRADLVRVSADKFLFEEVTICSVNPPGKSQKNVQI